MDYDIFEAFEAIENELIESMMRNFRRHRAEEDELGYNWSQWQAEQLKSLEQYRKTNATKFSKQFSSINAKVAEMLEMAREDGNAEQEIAILEAIQNGFKVPDVVPDTPTGEFFKVNNRKLDALIKATTSDLEKAETAILRRANDEYRSAIFNAQVYANTGAGTYEKAVDMAVRDMLRAGLSCVEYKNGSMHRLSEYAKMAIRTANKRAYLYGEGEKRQEWGISTVVVNSRQGGCHLCKDYIGKVFIDDVYSGGKKSDGDYPLLSDAIQHGLFHPNCKDSTSTYFEGITTLEPLSSDEREELDRRRKLEAQKNYYDNQAEKCDRISEHSLDKDNKRTYKKRALACKQKADELHDIILEQEEGKQGYKYKNTIIDSSMIKSTEYRRRFGKISNNEKVNRSIWNCAKEILCHRSGTKFEDLAFVDSLTGKSQIRKDYDSDLTVNPSKKMMRMLQNAKPYTIIGVHNHPLSSAPSLADINVCLARRYKYGVVVCHNGAIYKYSVDADSFNESILVLALAKLEKEGYNSTVEKIFRDSGVCMEVL